MRTPESMMDTPAANFRPSMMRKTTSSESRKRLDLTPTQHNKTDDDEE